MVDPKEKKGIIADISLRQVQGMFSIATFEDGNNGSEANIFS